MSDTADITLPLVKQLIKEQFPEFSDLIIQPVKVQGHDNRSFRLGTDRLIRMPTTAAYALKVPMEQKILPHIARRLTIDIPCPLKLGHPTKTYPFHFSIYRWIEGVSANTIKIEPMNKVPLARSLAHFLQELQSIDTQDAPEPGQHNWWRGDHISAYDQQAKNQIEQLKDIIDSNKALALWEKALSSRWCKNPVWIHGDLAEGNILIKNNTLSGIIDFGGVAAGDPACDLVIKWTFLEMKSRHIFHDYMNLDADTWTRARAWALWKATYELCNRGDKNDPLSITQKRIIDDLLHEQESSNY